MTTDRIIQRVIITGPTGAIGTALCRLLVERGIQVYAICRPGSPRRKALPESSLLRVVECDASHLVRLPDLLPEGADAFFHLAWAKTVGAGRNDMPAQIQNIQYTVDACHAAAELGCQVFVGAGSQAEYGRVEGLLKPETPCFPENGYGMAKLCAGQMSRVECQKQGIAHIWPRILSVYGPYDGMQSLISQAVQKLLLGEHLPLTAGEQLWDYLYADDAAQALLLMAQRGRDGAVYPLGSGMARPLKEYILQIREQIAPGAELGFGEIPYGPLQVMHLQADLFDLQRDTGFQPQTDFPTGIRQTITWMRSKC